MNQRCFNTSNNNLLVTVITPVYNAAQFLPDYLDSVLEQTWRPLQLICVDDESQDKSYDVLREYQARFDNSHIDFVLLQQTHSGQAEAFNKAFKAVKGDYITWCDADDLLHPNNIEEKAVYLIEHPDINMVRNNGIVVDGDTGRYLCDSARLKDKMTKNIFDDLFRDITYCYAGCYMLRANSFFSVYKDKKIPVSPEGQNIQLLFPLASMGKCGFIDDRLHTYMKRHNGHSSMSRSITERILRLKNFTQLKKNVLEYCCCDKEYYSALAEEIEEERMKILARGISHSVKFRKKIVKE